MKNPPFWADFLLYNEDQQLIEPVGKHAGAQTADGVADNGSAGQLAALQTVHHGNMGA